MSFIKIFLGDIADQLWSEQNLINVKNDQLKYVQTILNKCENDVNIVKNAIELLQKPVEDIEKLFSDYDYLFAQYVILQVLQDTFEDLHTELEDLIYTDPEHTSTILPYYEGKKEEIQNIYNKISAEIDVHKQNINAMIGNFDEIDINTSNNIQSIQTISSRIKSTIERIDSALKDILDTDIKYKYFTIESLADNNNIYLKASTQNIAGKQISISLDAGKTWTNYTSTTGDGTLIATLNKNKKILVKGNNVKYSTSFDDYTVFDSSDKFNISGNLMSLVYGDNFINENTLTNDHVLSKLFFGSNVVEASNSIINSTNIPTNGCDLMFGSCTLLKSAPQLPAKLIGSFGYSAMFQNCTSLEYGPQLPATTISANSYFKMFENCTAMYSGPKILPALTLPYGCYFETFNGCTSLYKAPYISATTVGDSCYYMFKDCTSLKNVQDVLLVENMTGDWCFNCMFYGCTSLVNAPELPATTLVYACYNSMFEGCTSLVNAPSILPATTLAYGCYANMFSGCTSLVNAPKLPATTLAERCYYSMFVNCKSLVIAPELPATTLVNNCYNGMFTNCISLINAPELPATTLTESCYSGMFRDCTALVTAPELLASNIAYACYENMFRNCTSLNYIKCLTDYDERTYDSWVDGVASTGTFIKRHDVEFPRGTSGIPQNWEVQNV